MAAAGFRIALSALLCAACTSVAVDARSFEGTRWHVTAINGRTSPPKGDYSVEFKGGGIGGRFGCNQFGGKYAVRGENLVASDIASTLMGCPEPAASFETQGFRVVNAPMRVKWSSDRRLTLSNSAGSIDLERLP
jgi:heat shock protein HslJ